MIQEYASESVTAGHPDKVADCIADALLDEYLKQDPMSRVAIEMFLPGPKIIIGGEVTSSAKDIDHARVVKSVLWNLGYDDESYGASIEDLVVENLIKSQSPEIAQGVLRTKPEEQGAGDQGIMFGYACRDTYHLMPWPFMIARALTDRLTEVREDVLPGLGLRPDGKSIAIVGLDERKGHTPRKPAYLKHVTIAAQHDPKLTRERLIAAVKEDILQYAMLESCGYDNSTMFPLADDFELIVNGTGSFIQGGPGADTGLTGRKLAVDSYGGSVRHGGGAFSGKDPSKVDRSATYFARYIAKNVVAAELADECEVSLAYTIGRAKPTIFTLRMKGTEVSHAAIRSAVMKVFSATANPEHFGRPHDIITMLDLRRPIYFPTAVHGHFGFNGKISNSILGIDYQRPWENLDRVEELQKEVHLQRSY